jgi:hypothetical protein
MYARIELSKEACAFSMGQRSNDKQCSYLTLNEAVEKLKLISLRKNLTKHNQKGKGTHGITTEQPISALHRILGDSYSVTIRIRELSKKLGLTWLRRRFASSDSPTLKEYA